MATIRFLGVMESNNFGTVMRLVEDGVLVIKELKMVEFGATSATPRQFAQELRAHGNRPREHSSRENGGGLRSLECVLAIMQARPTDNWDVQEIANALHADYGFNANSAASTLSVLNREGYVTRVAKGQYTLSSTGATHPQKEPLPFKVRREAE